MTNIAQKKGAALNAPRRQIQKHTGQQIQKPTGQQTQKPTGQQITEHCMKIKAKTVPVNIKLDSNASLLPEPAAAPTASEDITIQPPSVDYKSLRKRFPGIPKEWVEAHVMGVSVEKITEATEAEKGEGVVWDLERGVCLMNAYPK